MTQSKKNIGLMSGTSANGIDAALIEIEGTGVSSTVKLLAFETYEYTQEVKAFILEISSSACSAKQICHANFYIGDLFAQAALSVAQKARVPLTDITSIGSHGQTISHIPIEDTSIPFGVPSTLQIGEPAVIAEKTGITTVADFRTRDMAAGGIGAPLTPYANVILFAEKKKTKIVQNIGGISNLTLLKKGAHMDETISFDTGPGNMLIDSLIHIISGGTKEYDKNGDMAKQGNVDKRLLQHLLTHPFITKKPPKATGREDFGSHYAQEVYARGKKQHLADEDIIATVTACTVESMVSNYKQFIFPSATPDEIIIAGGGVYNKTIINMLREKLDHHIALVSSDTYSIPACALEAVSFALLAHATMEGIPNNIPRVTGAKKKVVLGKIVKK